MEVLKNPTPVGAAVALIGGKRATAWLVWALIATMACGIQSCRLNSEQAKGSACKGTVANFDAAQQGNLDTIADLQHRLAVEAEKRRMEATAHLEALTLATQAATAADATNNLLEQELERLYGTDQGASDWATTGVDAGVLASLPKHPDPD